MTIHWKNPFVAYAIAVLVLTASLRLQAQGTTFTYQGRLLDSGSPANGLYELQFVLYHSSNSVSQAGSPVYFYSVPVSNGLFAVPLNFGTAPFAGASGGSNWLDISVRVPGGNPSYTTLLPRIQLTATPYAVTAENLPPARTQMPSHLITRKTFSPALSQAL